MGCPRTYTYDGFEELAPGRLPHTITRDDLTRTISQCVLYPDNFHLEQLVSPDAYFIGLFSNVPLDTFPFMIIKLGVEFEGV